MLPLARRSIGVLALGALAAAPPPGGVAPLDSILDFPPSYQVASGAGLLDAADYGVQVGALSIGFTGVLGNVDAPLGGGCGILLSADVPGTVAFAVPRQAVGVCAADADFTVDVPATITLTAYAGDGSVVGASSGLLRAANSGLEQDRTAIFVGLVSDTPFKFVEISTSVAQTVALDNLIFERQ